jgi:hypothetical protein
MRTLPFILSLTCIIFISCSTPKTEDKQTGKTEDKTDTSLAIQQEGAQKQQIIYTCPMHAEVKSDKPGECPECGMALEPVSLAASAPGSFVMKFSFSPNAQPGKLVSLSLTPTEPAKTGEPVPLDVVHEKKIHLILTSKDLSWFDHVHPELDASGAYKLDYAFPKAGTYFLFADYKPALGTHITDTASIMVGTGQPTQIAYTKTKLTSQADELELALNQPNASPGFAAGTPFELTATVRLNGTEIPPTMLDDYLGAKAHMVIIKTDTYEYLHVHPGIENDRLSLKATFSKPGIYRGFLQVQYKGKIRTGNFVFNVGSTPPTNS